ncbi:DUF3822 family protein [Polaribacter vadi]|uniref:DUF3822 family protein n=1 Tax=Polaribacter vadi TaxID=1774273 RepID=UPI0030EF6109|tara:strand:+ start:1905 stop:2741 length:837 start_codon:yes stop_codon:yes gene_type:complete
MTNLKVQKNNSTISKTESKNIALSIQFSLDGFSFCVVNSLKNNIVYFKEYQFKETQNSPESLLEEIKVIFKNDANLQLEYNNVTVIHENNLATLVPNQFFNEDSLANYLSLNIKTLKNDFITFDEIDIIDAKNVYIPYVNINNYLFQNFGEFEYKHHNTILLEKLLKVNTSDKKVMYINVSKNTFDLIVLENNKLILSNSFSYISKEDFIYYVLFTAEQLQLDTMDFQLYFMGNITKLDAIYKITYKYIKNVFFLESNNSIFKELKIANHSNYILLGT